MFGAISSSSYKKIPKELQSLAQFRGFLNTPSGCSLEIIQRPVDKSRLRLLYGGFSAVGLHGPDPFKNSS